MSQLSRRKFLENSMWAATAALGAGGALGAGSLLNTKQLFGEEKSEGPSGILRVALIGAGSRGGEHMNEFLKMKSECEITVVCDADSERSNKYADHIEKETGKRPAVVGDMRKVMDNKDVDIVTTATPNHWHALVSIWAMQAGKDVYVEKPVSHNVSEGRRIVQTARKYNKICQTGTQCRSMGGTLQAIDYIKSGKIGEVKLARGLCYKNRGSIGEKGKYEVPGTVDYDLWCGPAEKLELTRPKLHYDWHWVWNTGNGDLGNQGIHQMDIARWGLGVNDIGNSVLSYGGRIGYIDAGETANTQVSIHDYGDKTLVFETRGLPTSALREAKVGVIFYGSEGYVVLTGYTKGAAFDLDGNMVQEFRGDGDHFGNFVQAVRSRNAGDLAADIEQGHLSSALCHLGNISMRVGESVSIASVKERLDSMPNKAEVFETFDRFNEHVKENGLDPEKTNISYGKVLTIDPKEEIFVGEHASMANPMLTREYRAPFVVPASV